MDWQKHRWSKYREWQICYNQIWQTTSKNATKVRAARAARLFSLIQPIIVVFRRFNCQSRRRGFNSLIESLGNHADDGHKNVNYLHIWQQKTIVLHALHVHFSFLDILKTFSFFLRREMTCIAVVWTTWAYDDKCSNLFSNFWSNGSNLTPK